MHYSRFKVHGTPHSPGRRHQTAACIRDGCSKKPIAKDLCRYHYYAERKPPKAPQAMRGRQPCSIAGCTSWATGRGWCGAHYQRWRRFGDPTFYPPEMDRSCSVAGCERSANARRLCSAHYRRWHLYGDPQFTKHRSPEVGPGDKVCDLEGCARRTNQGAALCPLHYGRLRRHGDVNVRSVQRSQLCVTCGCDFDPGDGRARKYCGKTCKPSGRIAGSVNKRSWVLLLGNEDGWHCWLCELPVNRGLYWPNPDAGSVDHILPVSLGGIDDRSNLRLAHLRCNVSRKNKLIAPREDEVTQLPV